MARKKIVMEQENNALTALNELIESYGKNNDSFKALKKVVDKENADIKALMLENIKPDEDNTRIVKAGEYIAVLSIQDRSSMNEERLIQWLKKNGFSKGIIKKKEYVDGKALENAIYKGEIPEDKVSEMESCKDPNDVKVLNVKKVKKENK